jgi:hypothetical protein
VAAVYTCLSTAAITYAWPCCSTLPYNLILKYLIKHALSRNFYNILQEKRKKSCFWNYPFYSQHGGRITTVLLFYGPARYLLHWKLGWLHCHRLLKRNLASNIWGGGGGQNWPWVLETLFYKGIKFWKRGKLVPQNSSFSFSFFCLFLFNIIQFSNQKKTIPRLKKYWEGAFSSPCAPPPKLRLQVGGVTTAGNWPLVNIAAINCCFTITHSPSAAGIRAVITLPPPLSLPLVLRAFQWSDYRSNTVHPGEIYSLTSQSAASHCSYISPVYLTMLSVTQTPYLRTTGWQRIINWKGIGRHMLCPNLRNYQRVCLNELNTIKKNLSQNTNGTSGSQTRYLLNTTHRQ